MASENDQIPNQALFLDMDGTLITTQSGQTYPQGVDDWQLAYENVVGRIHQYKARGYKIVIVTNQGGIECNFVTEEEIKTKLANVISFLQRPGTETDYIFPYYCPHMASFYRKPNPGMAYQAALDHNIALNESVMVGDRASDEQFAKRAGIGTFHYASEFFSDPVRDEL